MAKTTKRRLVSTVTWHYRAGFTAGAYQKSTCDIFITKRTVFLPFPEGSSYLPEWGRFQVGWDMWYQSPCSHPGTWGKFLLWRTVGWLQSLLQHPPSPLGVWDHPHSCLPQDGLWGILNSNTFKSLTNMAKGVPLRLSTIDVQIKKPTGNTNVKIILKLWSDMFNKIDGEVKSSLLLLPVCSHWVFGNMRTTQLTTICKCYEDLQGYTLMLFLL